MSRLLSSLCFLLSASLLGSAIAQGAPSFIGVDEIRPGMKGYGLTVFRGTEPERFDVEVIDVLRNFRPAQDLILLRTPHPVLDRARGVAGMSGSPIFLDGRLAGAYAYGWPYGTDPVVGVTPISNMLAELKRPVRLDMFPGARPLPAARPRASRTDARPSRDRFAGLPPFSGTATDAFSTLRAAAKKKSAQRGPVGLQAATTPIMMGGFTDSVARMLTDELAPLGLDATQAGSSGTAKGGPRKFENGGAIAVTLATGDVSLTGVGTVTYMARGNRVLAFGHPMLDAGATGFPTATARVLHVLVSEFRSFKIAEAARPLGTLVQDRQSAIVVDPAIEAARIPVRVRIRGAEGAQKTEWNVDIVSHRTLTPSIAFAVIANAMKSTAGDMEEVIFRARSTVGIAGHDSVTLNEQGYSPSGPASQIALSQLNMFWLMDAAFANPFEASRVTSIDLELDLDFTREVFRVVDASVAFDEVDPGQETTVYVRLRQVGKKDTIRGIKVRIPEAAAGQTINLAVAGGNAVRVELPRAASLNDLIEQAGAGFPATSLVVSLQMPTRGLQFEGHVVDSLPASALNSLQLVSTSEDSRPFVTRSHTEVELPEVVFGTANLRLRVRDVAREQLLGN
ncbi:MAG: hypothetical protein WBG86_20945 [Polyangiales bacterium]